MVKENRPEGRGKDGGKRGCPGRIICKTVKDKTYNKKQKGTEQMKWQRKIHMTFKQKGEVVKWARRFRFPKTRKSKKNGRARR